MSVGKDTVFLLISSLVCLFVVVTPVSAIPVDLTTTGSLSFDSAPPGSGVFLDGFYKGLTPVTINYLAPGTHAVQIGHAGYYDWKSTVTVSAGETNTVFYTLDPVQKNEMGWIYVSSTPGGLRLQSTVILLEGPPRAVRLY